MCIYCSMYSFSPVACVHTYPTCFLSKILSQVVLVVPTRNHVLVLGTFVKVMKDSWLMKYSQGKGQKRQLGTKSKKGRERLL